MTRTCDNTPIERSIFPAMLMLRNIIGHAMRGCGHRERVAAYPASIHGRLRLLRSGGTGDRAQTHPDPPARLRGIDDVVNLNTLAIDAAVPLALSSATLFL